MNYMNKSITMARHIIFLILWIIIGLISGYDCYWLVKNQEVLAQVEKNPVGLWLIHLDQGDVALFAAAKLTGTVIVLGILTLMLHWKPKWAMTVAFALAIQQIILFFYLQV